MKLTGTERLGPGHVVDFWRWALGDLQMNTARGVLAEWLVARALEDPRPSRVEWGPYDVKSKNGTLVEVKATGLLQSWPMAEGKKPSPPKWTFNSVSATKVWSPERGEDVEVDPFTRVHVWVFALHKVTEQALYDPLDTSAWEFRAMAHRRLLATGQKSARLSTLTDRWKLGAVDYADLPDAVAEARRDNEDFVR